MFLPQGHSSGKPPSLSEKNSNTSPSTSTPKSQTPRPASAGMGVPLHPGGTPSSAGHSDNDSPQTRPGRASSNNSILSHRMEGGGTATPAGPVPGSGDGDVAGGMTLPDATVSPSGSPSILSAHLQAEAGQRSGPGSADRLSKEQLEHRERSLQTLRDIERLLLRSGTSGGPADTGGPNNPASNNNSSNLNSTNSNERGGVIEDGDNGTNTSGNCSSGNMLPSSMIPVGGLKRYEEPLQSIISQTQSLGGAAIDSPQMDPHLLQHPHHPLSSPGIDMGHLLGPEGVTPEQMAWRKLQEEYYLEKRRQQEMQPPTHPQHFRMMSEMGMHGGPMMMRGPPPPYHSKPGDQQWGPGNMMPGGMAANARMMEMHQDGPRGPRFLGQMQRGPPGGGAFPGGAGGPLSVEGLGPQRAPRPGMIWADDMPNNLGGGGPFHGCYPGGPPQHLQGDPEHPLMHEEMFRLIEKRQQMQGISRFELERLSKQQQQANLGSRIMDNPGGPDFPNLGMGRGPPSARGDPMDFPGSREMMGSPGGGPQMRDLVDSPLGGNLPMNMNSQMNVQQQQQMILSQKLRGGPVGGGPLGEMFSPGEISRMRAAQNGRGGGKGMTPGPDGPFQFPNQGPFSGPQVEGAYLQQPAPEMFAPEQQGPSQMGGTSRLSHLPMGGGLRGAELSPRHPSDLSINVNPMTSPSVPPPHQLKSPSLNQEPSPLLPSPSAPGLKSPSAAHHPPLPPASGAGTPSSSSMKSPQVMGSSNLVLHSPSASPGRLKSPAMAVASPGGWASPKTAHPSPGGPTSGKIVGNGGSSSTETGTASIRDYADSLFIKSYVLFSH